MELIRHEKFTEHTGPVAEALRSVQHDHYKGPAYWPSSSEVELMCQVDSVSAQHMHLWPFSILFRLLEHTEVHEL